MAQSMTINAGEAKTGFTVANVDDGISELTVYGVLYGPSAEGYYGGKKNIVQTNGTISVLDGGVAYDVQVSTDGNLKVNNGKAYNVVAAKPDAISAAEYQSKISVAGVGLIDGITLSGGYLYDQAGYLEEFCNAYLEVAGDALVTNGEFDFVTIHADGGSLENIVLRGEKSVLETGVGTVVKNVEFYSGTTLTYTIGAGSQLQGSIVGTVDGEKIVYEKLAYGSSVSGKKINDDYGVTQNFVLEAGGSIANTKLEDNTSLIANAGKISNLTLGVVEIREIKPVNVKINGDEVVASKITVYNCGGGSLTVNAGTVNNVNVLGGRASFAGGVTKTVTASGVVAESEDGLTTTVRGNALIQISDDAVVSNVTVKDGADFSQIGGYAENVTIFARSMPNFGGGVTYSLSGGEAHKVTLKTGTAGQFTDAIARLNVTGSGSVTSATLNKNTEMKVAGAGAFAADAVVNQGGRMFVSANAQASNTVVKKSGLLKVETGAVETGATIFAGGSMFVDSTAASFDAEVKGGGIMTVAAGGYADGTTVAKNGKMDVQLISGTYWAGTSAGVDFQYGTIQSDGTVGKMTVSAFTATSTRKGTVQKAVVDNVLVDKNGEFGVREDAKLNNVAVNANGKLVVVGGTGEVKESGAIDASAQLTDVRVYKNGKMEFTAGLVNTTQGSITTQRAYATAVGTSNYIGFSYGATLEDVTADKTRSFTVTQNGIARNMTVASGGKLTVTAAIVGTQSEVVDNVTIVTNIYEGGTVDGLTVNKGATVYVYDGAKLTGDIVLNNKVTAINAELNFNLIGKDMFNNDWCVTNFSNLNGSGMTYTLDLEFGQAAGEYKLASKAQNFNGTIRVVTNATSSGSSTTQLYHDLKIGERYYHEEAGRYLTVTKVNGDLWLKVEYDAENPVHNLALAELDDEGDVLFIVGNGELKGDSRVYVNDKLSVSFQVENDSKVDYKQSDFGGKYELTVVNQLTGEVVKRVTDTNLTNIAAGQKSNVYSLENFVTIEDAGIYDVTLTLKNNIGVYDTVRETITVMDENSDLYFNTKFDTVDRYQNNGDEDLAGAYAGGKEKRTILLGELNAGIYSFGNMVFDEDFTGTVKLLNEDLKTVINVSVKNGVANLAGAVLEEGSYAIQIQGAKETDYEFQLVAGEVFENYTSAYTVNNGTWVDAHHFANDIVNIGEPVADDPILNIQTVIGADNNGNEILLKIGDTTAVKAIEFVGNESGNNRYTFGVTGVGGDDSIKFSLVSVTDGTKVKTVKSVKLNADGTLGDAMLIKPADNVDYYLIVEDLNAKKGVESDLHLWVDTDATLVKKANNADDVMMKANAVKLSDLTTQVPTPNQAVITSTFENPASVQISDWVGSTDTVDWFVLNIDNEGVGTLTDAEGNVTQVSVGKTGKYTFSIDNADVENGTSFTVYRAYDDNKDYSDSIKGAASATVKVAGASNEKETKAVDLLTGTYYIQVTNRNSKNYLKDTEYNLNINLQDERKELFVLNDENDSLAMNTADEYYFVLDDYSDITFSSVKGMTLFQDNGKNGMSKITVKANQTITLAAGIYYINTTAKCDPIGILNTESDYEHGTVNNSNDSWLSATEIILDDNMKFTTNIVDNDVIKTPEDDDMLNADGKPIDANGNIIYDAVTPDAWVGYGDKADYYKLNVTGATAGKYTISLDDAEVGNVKLTVYRTQTDKNGVASLVKMSGITYTASKNSIVINDLLDGTYYVAVETTKAGTALTSKNSDYTLDIEAAAYVQLDKVEQDLTTGEDVLVGEKIASGSYGTFTLTGKSLVALTSTEKISGATIYYNNGKNGFQAVTVTDNKAVLEAGTYYVKASCKEAIKAEKTVITDESTVIDLELAFDINTGLYNFAYSEGGSTYTSINGWVGLNAAEDSFYFTSGGDNANAYGWTELTLTVNDTETLMAAKTSVTFSVYHNTGTDEKPVWKLVTSDKYTAGEKDNTIKLGFDMRNDTDYKFVVTTSDKGKGNCNVDYTITGDIANSKLDKKDIGTVSTALVQDSTTQYTMSATVQNGYAVLEVDNLSMLTLAKNYKLYSANAAGNLVEVKLYGKNGLNAVVDTGIYYISGSNGEKELGTIEEIVNPELQPIRFDATTAADNKSIMNLDTTDPDNPTDGINGWVGVSNATDDYFFNTYSDGTADAGWVNFELSSLTDQFNNGAKVTMTLYKNVNGSWKKVTGITTASGTKLSGNSFGASLDDDTEYKLSIESADKGKGAANLSYELDGTLDYYDLDNNSILTASRLVFDSTMDTDTEENTVTNTWDATVTKAGDKVDFYDVNDLDELKIAVEKGGSVKVTWYDENFDTVKANGSSLTVSGSATILSDSAAYDEVRYVKIEAIGSANNHYTLSSTVTKS